MCNFTHTCRTSPAPHLPWQTVFPLEEITPRCLERPPVAETYMCNAKKEMDTYRFWRYRNSLEKYMAYLSHHIPQAVYGAVVVVGSLQRAA